MLVNLYNAFAVGGLLIEMIFDVVKQIVEQSLLL